MKNRLRRIFALKCGNGSESECPTKREVLKKLSILFFFQNNEEDEYLLSRHQEERSIQRNTGYLERMASEQGTRI